MMANDKTSSKELFKFQDHNGRTGVCHLEIINNEDNAIAIVTEIADNTGMSVTNAAECLIAQVCRAKVIDPATLVWIEHYSEKSYKQKTKPRVEYSLVTFKLSKSAVVKPVWKPMEKMDWIELGLTPR